MGRTTSSALLLALGLGLSGCRSELIVEVEQYQGEAILAPASQVERIKSMTRSSFRSVYEALDEGNYLLRDLMEFDGGSGIVRMEAVRRIDDLQLLAWQLAADYLPGDDRQSALDVQKWLRRRAATYEAEEGNGSADAVSLEVEQHGDEEEGAVASVGPESRTPTRSEIQDLATELVDKVAARLIVREGIPDAELPAAERVLTKERVAANCSGYAEVLHAMARAVETLDEDVFDYLHARYSYVEDDPGLFGFFLSEDFEYLYQRYQADLDRLFLADRFSGAEFSDEDKEIALELSARYFEYYYNVWRALEENYLRISGLANFILKGTDGPSEGSGAGEQSAERPDLEAAIRGLEARLVARASSANPEDAEAVSKALEELAALQPKLERALSTYSGVRSTGAYLALAQAFQAIGAQGRPGILVREWEPVTTIQVRAGANANYVVMRDHLGNWQVKDTENDPSAQIEALSEGLSVGIQVSALGGNLFEQFAAAHAARAEARGEDPELAGMPELVLALSAHSKEVVEEIRGETEDADLSAEQRTALVQHYESYRRTLDLLVDAARQDPEQEPMSDGGGDDDPAGDPDDESNDDSNEAGAAAEAGEAGTEGEDPDATSSLTETPPAEDEEPENSKDGAPGEGGD